MSVLNPSNPLRRSGGGGQNGMSAYEIALTNGFVGTEQEWLNSLVGPDGSQGPIGPEGKSAYEIAVENGFEGTEQEWLASLVGPEGTEGPQGPQGSDGPQGNPGVDGQDGISPTVSISAIEGGHELKITDAIGEQSFNVMNGQEGKSAYEIAVENGFEGSEWDWLNSLVGPEGQQGIPGDQGPQGIQGVDGAQGIPGPQGEAFSIAKVYSSVEEMNSDFGNSEIKEGQFVLINTDDVEDEDNAKLFVKTLIGFRFVTDLSGAQGMRGPQGIQGIQGVQGVAGQNGFTPTIEVEEIDNGHRITVTNQSGTTVFDVKDGADGTSDLQTIRDTVVQNRSDLDSLTVPSCVHFVDSYLAHSFPNDILYLAITDNLLTATTLNNVTLTFEIDPTTGELILVNEGGSIGSTIVSFDNSMTESDGVYGVANPMQGIFTQTEYNALSEEQKTKGTYMVSDGEGEGSDAEVITKIISNGKMLMIPSSSEGKSAYEIAVENGFEGSEQEWLASLVGPEGPIGQDVGNVYSTEEIVIGTWIDGKPVYRKVFQHVAPTDLSINVTKQFSIGPVPSKDTLVSLRGSIPSSTTASQYNIPSYGVNGWFDIACWNNMIYAYFNCANQSIANTMAGANFHVIAEYTKNTDKPGSGLAASQAANLIFGHGLLTHQQDSKTLVEVDTVDDFTGDKTLPMSAVGVETQIGNIESLLETI